MFLKPTFISLALALATSVTATLPQLRSNVQRPVNLRIEGESSTIFEGIVWTRGQDVTTQSGGTHKCDGTTGETTTSAATATGALADAAKTADWDIDATWSDELNDFVVTSVGDSAKTEDKAWGALHNFKLVEAGGCNQQVTELTDKVVWAYDAANAEAFLKLEVVGTAEPNTPFQVLVTNGATGSPIAGATVGGVTTGEDGKATLTLGETTDIKAEKAGSVRSNAVKVVV